MAMEQPKDGQHSANQPHFAYPPEKAPGLYRFVLGVARVFMSFIYPMRVHGKENLDGLTRQMLICNHQQWTDAFTVGLLQRRVTHYMGKVELFEIPVVSWLLRSLGAFPIRRGQADIGAIKKAIGILKEDRALCIFPEGTRNHDNSMKEFQKGAAAIALKGGAPVVPVYISKYRAFHPVHVWIGKPVHLNGLRSDEGTTLIHQAILALEESAQV